MCCKKGIAWWNDIHCEAFHFNFLKECSFKSSRRTVLSRDNLQLSTENVQNSVWLLNLAVSCVFEPAFYASGKNIWSNRDFHNSMLKWSLSLVVEQFFLVDGFLKFGRSCKTCELMIIIFMFHIACRIIIKIIESFICFLFEKYIINSQDIES